MLSGVMPALPLGHISIYYGGEAISSQLYSRSFWRWFPMNFTFSLLFQVTLFLYKTLRSGRLNVQQRLKAVLVGNLLNLNRSIFSLYNNLLNLNSLLTILAGGLAGCGILFANYLLFEINKDDTVLLPPSILAYCTILLFFQWRPFFKNHGLR